MKDMTEEELDEFLWKIQDDYAKIQEYIESENENCEEKTSDT